MGRKAMPIELLLIQGNKNKLTKSEIEARRAAEEKIKPNSNKVRAPSWLSKEAKKEFKKIADELLQTELLTNVDVNQLAVYADLITSYAEERQKEVRDNKELNRLSKEIKAWSIEFGLTPSSRAKLAMPKEEEKEKSTEEKMFGDV